MTWSPIMIDTNMECRKCILVSKLICHAHPFYTEIFKRDEISKILSLPLNLFGWGWNFIVRCKTSWNIFSEQFNINFNNVLGQIVQPEEIRMVQWLRVEARDWDIRSQRRQIFWFGCGVQYVLARSLQNGTKNTRSPLCVCTPRMQSVDPPLPLRKE